MQNLTSKKCVPCEGGTLPLNPEEIKQYVSQTPQWEVLENKKIRREFKFKDFQEAVRFINKVADLAEREGHHPDIHLHNWNCVRFELSTHAIGGLSENDFILAAKINALDDEAK